MLAVMMGSKVYQLVAAAESVASSAVVGVMTYDDNVAMTTKRQNASAENVLQRAITSSLIVLSKSTNKNGF